MVSTSVSWREKSDILFLETHSAKVDSRAYMELLRNNLLHACEKLYLDGFIL